MMNCNDTEKQLLLAASGELAAGKQEALTRHLEDCEACRAVRDQLQALTARLETALKTGEPGAFVMTRIRAAAERRVHRPLIFRSPSLQVLAYAAALAVVVGGWFMVSGNGRLDRIDQVNTLLVMASDEGTEVVGAEGVGEDAELRALARQLLEMEGLAADEYDEEAWFTPDEALPPTAFRGRSTPASPQKKCV